MSGVDGGTVGFPAVLGGVDGGSVGVLVALSGVDGKLVCVPDSVGYLVFLWWRLSALKVAEETQTEYLL